MTTRPMSTRAALAQALQRIMTHDPDVFVAGHGMNDTRTVLHYDDLRQHFGTMRVVDTPPGAHALAGLALGSAVSGLRPIVDLGPLGSATGALDVLRRAAELRFRSGDRASAPLTAVAQIGTDRRFGTTDSGSIESLLASFPGASVVVPSTTADASSLLASAVNLDDPVFYLVPVDLLDTQGTVPDDPTDVPIGRSATLRTGTDVTIIAYGASVAAAQTAADQLVDEGIEPEVIDLRTLQPLDLESISESVRRCNRCVVVHQALRLGGLGSEIAAQIQEHCFDYLDAPVGRIGAPFATPSFGAAVSRDRSQVAEIVRAVGATIGDGNITSSG